MDTSVKYMFKNVGSGLYMEVADASAEAGANVQQWTWNDNDCQKWKLIPVDYTLPYQEIKTVEGDVNKDGKFDKTDAVLMQKWLLGADDSTLADWKAGDLTGDGVIDVFDLVAMRKALVK